MSMTIAYKATDNFDAFNQAVSHRYHATIEATGHGFGQRLVKLAVETDVRRSEVLDLATRYGIEIENICMWDRTDIRVIDA